MMRRRAEEALFEKQRPISLENSKKRPRRRQHFRRSILICVFFFCLCWIIWPATEKKMKPTALLRRRAQQIRAQRSKAISPAPPRRSPPPQRKTTEALKSSGGQLANEFHLVPIENSRKWITNKRAYISVLVNVGREEVVYFREWIEYHILIAGIRRFWLILDECDGDTRARIAAQPYIEAGIAKAFADKSCSVFGDDNQVSALVERVYTTQAERATRWFAALHLNEYLISPMRYNPVATELTHVISNPLFESIDPNLINKSPEPVIQLSSISFPDKIYEMSMNGSLTVSSLENSEMVPTFSIGLARPRNDRPLVKWGPSLNDVLSSLDDSNALDEWGGVAFPIMIFGDSGHLTPLSDVSVFATYTRRADPDRARSWRARSYTTLFNTNACELLRPDVYSSVHVCSKAKIGWSPKAHTAIGDVVPPERPILTEELRDKLYASGAPMYPYVARYTRSSTEWASQREDAVLSPPREFAQVSDKGVLQSIERRLEALYIAISIMGKYDGEPLLLDYLGELARLLLGRNYLRQIIRPELWLVEALFRAKISNITSTCVSCDVIAAVGEGWERASLLFYDETTHDDIFEGGEDIEKKQMSQENRVNKQRKRKALK
mmetsp:Transcript_6439/g.9594  ORF Transcript_6439/g.9594 Transcript_6439/m.9594 type:complete len:610 (+) Transcript_6439:43-1872(+)